VTWTDFAEGQDHVSISWRYSSNDTYNSTSDFIAMFDANEDNALSREDGTSGSNGIGESFNFTASGLTIHFDNAHVTLNGADYLI
jgi:hypothetical protein